VDGVTVLKDYCATISLFLLKAKTQPEQSHDSVLAARNMETTDDNNRVLLDNSIEQLEDVTK